MKNILKLLLEMIIEPYKGIDWLTLFCRFLLSLQLFLFILVPYITMLIVSIFLTCLTGHWMDYITFTKDYFYCGSFCDILAWRWWLGFYFLCVFISLTTNE